MSRGSRARALAVTVTVVLTALLAPASPAAADPIDVPDSATLTVEGDGSGHGMGLSQYGAYGAARAPHNLRSGQILDFYYPGTSTGRAAGKVKVWISGDDERDLVVGGVRGLTVRNLATGRTWRVPANGARLWRVRPNRAGDNVVSFRTRRWRTWRVVDGDVELSAGRRPLALHTRAGTTRYRGTLRLVRFHRKRLTVNVVPMEHYLRGVVPAEMQAGWPQQALRAQAVAARTFAAHERGDGNRYYDLCDTAACQSYGGASAEDRRSDDAVRATAGDILTYRGETAYAQYSASNGGWTVADDRYPYLVAQRDPHEGTSSDYYGWRRQVAARVIERAYDIENLTGIEVETGEGRGPRVETVWLESSTGWTGRVTGESFRRNFGLPSTLFEIAGVRSTG
ncbi:MAG TPA: SpoIID/LytB domain-containing protein [Nocardioides sp.]|nr:SpoIID/LytB domain-containing protein [Nocardioides sp.]